MPSLKIKNIPSQAAPRKRADKSKLRLVIISLNILMILALAAIWITSTDIRASKHLLVLFFYTFPSHFLIALLPHEPVVIFFGKFYSPLTVAFVAVAGTVTIETVNYSIIKVAAGLKPFEKVRLNRLTQKILHLFNKAPFIALLAAGILPVPYYPFRFLVVLARYSLVKYALSIFISRFCRFYLLSTLGSRVRIPDGVLIAVFLIILITTNSALLRKRRQGTVAVAGKKSGQNLDQ